MKNIFKKITYIVLGTVFAFAFLISPKEASATLVDYIYSIPYVVTQTPPPVITVDITASPSSMTLPTNQTILSWTTTGSPDSCSAFGSWSGAYGGGNGTETKSGLAQGSYTYQIICFKVGSQNAMDSVTVTVSQSGPSVTGQLTISPNTCYIPSGGTTCTVTGATWTTSGATSPQVIDGNTNAVISTLANNSTPVQVWVAYPSTMFYLKDGVTTLDSDPAFASCASGTAWDGLTCTPSSVVNGICARSHFFCTAGTSANNNTSPSSWTWTCQGSGGGTNASCFESRIGGCTGPDCGGGGDDPLPECSDAIDNEDPEDLLVDTEDPACHSDKDPNNPATYMPLKDSERNIKPIWIEI